MIAVLKGSSTDGTHQDVMAALSIGKLRQWQEKTIKQWRECKEVQRGKGREKVRFRVRVSIAIGGPVPVGRTECLPSGHRACLMQQACWTEKAQGELKGITYESPSNNTSPLALFTRTMVMATSQG